jgi:adenylate cyclase
VPCSSTSCQTVSYSPLKRCIAKATRPSLQRIFTLPVLIQLIAVVGVVGYLSYRNTEQAVQNLASQLRKENSFRIQRELQGYFGDPHAINRINAAAFRARDLDVINASHGENLMFQQMRVYPNIAFVYCGSSRSGEFFGVMRQPDSGELQLSYSNQASQSFREYYSLDVRGNRLHRQAQSNRTYDSRLRPWFHEAVRAESPVWTDVYLAFSTGLPIVTASLPVYDDRDREILGVCATDVVLPEEFRTFLKHLSVGESGQAFVLDRTGHLISSSTDEPLMVGSQDQPQFLNAVDSQNPLVRGSTHQLLEQFGNLNDIRQSKQLIFELNGQRHYLEILPFSDAFGLDWLIVVVAPEADFMKEIQANNRTTILACGLALAIALLVGIISTRLVTRPIFRLNAAVKEIAQGNWHRLDHCNRRDELGELAKSVNSMAMQLQTSFETLEAQKDAFARFFPPNYLQFFDKDSVTQIELGDHITADMTVMFSDIRQFTSLAEKMEPQEIFNFINVYLQRMSPEIHSHQGFVVKFIGDGMMSVFPKRVENAIDAGIAQFEQMRQYNADRRAEDEHPIDIGIGLHFGHLMVGMIGEPSRLQGDALSDTVNLAARLENLTRLYGASLLISEAIKTRIENEERYHLRFLDQVIVKGRTEPIAIYEVLDAEVAGSRQLKLETLDAYMTGITHYRASTDRAPHHLHDARVAFQRVLAVNSQDKTARLYRDRIDTMLLRGLPENWTGAWAFSEKK